MPSAMVTLEHLPAAYVLEGSDGAYRYKGACRDLPERMRAHQEGHVSRTKNRRPLRLIFFEYFECYAEALRRETYLKSGAGREWLERRLRKGLSAYGPADGPTADPP